jgi:hypothetical protein
MMTVACRHVDHRWNDERAAREGQVSRGGWWEPCTADAVARWVRVWRRPNGADPDQRNQRPGPWHAIADAGRYSSEQTWCGRRLRGIAQEHTDDPDNDERNDARCIECTRAIGQGRPRAWARR